MECQLIRIGNSRGIRIPKPLIEQCGFGDTVELRVENSQLIIAAKRKPRQGWEEAFCAASCPASGQKDELLLEGAAPNPFDDKEWEW
jgi:antitoxin MazE